MKRKERLSAMKNKKALIMCRTGMGSSMMLKIKVDKLITKNKYPLDVTHDAFSGFAGQQKSDIIITMDDLVSEFDGSTSYIIGVKDIMDIDYLEAELNKYFDMNK